MINRDESADQPVAASSPGRQRETSGNGTGLRRHGETRKPKERLGARRIAPLLAAWALLVAAGGARAPTEEDPGKPWRERFELIDAEMKYRGLSDSLNTNGTLAWGQSYILHAYVEMYRATGDGRYIARALEQSERVMANRDDRRGVLDAVRGRIVPAWGSTKYSSGRYKGKNHVWVVHTGMITYPMALVVDAIRRSADLQHKYGKRATALLEQVRQSVDAHDEDFRWGPAQGEGYYVLAIRGPSSVAPLNQQNALGRTHVALSKLTGEAKYRRKAEALARYFKNRLTYRAAEDAYVWPYLAPPKGKGRGAEDISHAAINVDFAVVAHRAGIVFTRQDMNRFAHTLTRLISKGDGRLAERVDGSGRIGVYSVSVGRWLELAAYDREVWRIARDYYMEAEPSGPVAMLGYARLLKYLEPGRP